MNKFSRQKKIKKRKNEEKSHAFIVGRKYSISEEYSGSFQPSKMKLFARIHIFHFTRNKATDFAPKVYYILGFFSSKGLFRRFLFFSS